MPAQFRTPCGHQQPMKCGATSVYCCRTCDRYFEAVERVEYPEELPRMREVEPVYVNPADHASGWTGFRVKSPA